MCLNKDNIVHRKRQKGLNDLLLHYDEYSQLDCQQDERESVCPRSTCLRRDPNLFEDRFKLPHETIRCMSHDGKDCSRHFDNLKQMVSTESRHDTVIPLDTNCEYVIESASGLPMCIQCTCGLHQKKDNSHSLPPENSKKRTAISRTSLYAYPPARRKQLGLLCELRGVFLLSCLELWKSCSVHVAHGLILLLCLSSTLFIEVQCFNTNFPDDYKSFYREKAINQSLFNFDDCIAATDPSSNYQQSSLCICNKIAFYMADLKHSKQKNFLGFVRNQSFCQIQQPESNWLFCNHLPVNNLLFYDFNLCDYRYQFNGTCLDQCQDNIMDILRNDHRALQDYLPFLDTLMKYTTPRHYSVQWNIRECLAAYKSWVCSEHHKLYRTTENGSLVIYKPCSTHCLAAEASCPFFRIYNQTKLRGGQPVFICRGLKTENEPALTMSDCYNCSSKAQVNQHHHHDHRHGAVETPTVTMAGSHHRRYGNSTTHKLRHSASGGACVGCTTPGAPRGRSPGPNRAPGLSAAFTLCFLTVFFQTRVCR